MLKAQIPEFEASLGLGTDASGRRDAVRIAFDRDLRSLILDFTEARSELRLSWQFTTYDGASNFCEGLF
jgi:hypothetical protein